jgi:hypothetical protein
MVSSFFAKIKNIQKWLNLCYYQRIHNRKRKLDMKIILYSPWGRAIFALLSTFGSGILCSSVVTDITVEGKLDFSLLTSSRVFIVTLVFIALLFLYLVPMIKFDLAKNEDLKDYQDKDLLKSYYEGQHKPLVKLAKRQAKLGNLDKLEDINNYAKGVFGSERTINDKPSKDKDSGAI